MSIRKKWQLFGCLVLIVLGLDQATKLYVHTTFALHESRPVIDNLFAFTYVRNSGAAFGLLARQSPDISAPLLSCGHHPGTGGAAHLFRAGTVAVHPEAVGSLPHYKWCAR